MTTLPTSLATWGLLAAVVGAAPLTREEQADLLLRAQVAYDEAAATRSSTARAAYRTAAENFQIVVDSGILNGRLFYNLGNARLQCGELGAAILNYRRAEQLIPGDPQLRHNLAYARSLRRTQIPLSPDRTVLRTLFAWHYGVTTRSRWFIGLGAYLAFWLLIGLRWIRPQVRWSFGAIPCLIVWAAMAGSLAVDHFNPRPPAGILIADDVIVLKGNGADFQPVFTEPLHQGVEFNVLDVRDPWWHIELPDGQDGWIRAEQAAQV